MLYVVYAERAGFKSVIVKIPDSDIFFILLHHVHKFKVNVFMDLGVGKNREIVDILLWEKDLVHTMLHACWAQVHFMGEKGDACGFMPAKKLQKTHNTRNGLKHSKMSGQYMMNYLRDWKHSHSLCMAMQI